MRLITTKQSILLIILLLIDISLYAQKKGYDGIYSGIPWFDNNLNTVSAHSASIVKESGKFYLFGEYKSDSSNCFAGFSCYSSTDLFNWKFEKIVLPPQVSGILGPNRVGERAKVLKCPKTGEFVMFMHTDDLNYMDPYIGYATSSTINGTYTFHGPILFNGKPIKRWDMGMFQDSDGSGYLIIHHGSLFKLNDDYTSIAEQTAKDVTDGESPAIIKKNNVYFWLASNLTGWERNDNFYYTATSLSGPWVSRGLFAPKDKLTWNSQTTYVLPIIGSKDTTYIFMGDRWSHPRQNSAATYVWQPMKVEGNALSIPDYEECWNINLKSGESYPVILGKKFIDNTNSIIKYFGKWEHSIKDDLTLSSSETKGSSFSITFKGTQIGIYCLATNKGGYAKVSLINDKGVSILTSTIDMYSKYSVSTLKFLSPKLKKDVYTLKVTVIEDKWGWVDKYGEISGSQGFEVNLDKVYIKKLSD